MTIHYDLGFSIWGFVALQVLFFLLLADRRPRWVDHISTQFCIPKKNRRPSCVFFYKKKHETWDFGRFFQTLKTPNPRTFCFHQLKKYTPQWKHKTVIITNFVILTLLVSLEYCTREPLRGRFLPSLWPLNLCRMEISRIELYKGFFLSYLTDCQWVWSRSYLAIPSPYRHEIVIPIRVSSSHKTIAE